MAVHQTNKLLKITENGFGRLTPWPREVVLTRVDYDGARQIGHNDLRRVVTCAICDPPKPRFTTLSGTMS